MATGAAHAACPLAAHKITPLPFATAAPSPRRRQGELLTIGSAARPQPPPGAACEAARLGVDAQWRGIGCAAALLMAIHNTTITPSPFANASRWAPPPPTPPPVNYLESQSYEATLYDAWRFVAKRGGAGEGARVPPPAWWWVGVIVLIMHEAALGIAAAQIDSRRGVYALGLE